MRATDAVLEFLRTTKVGCVGTGRVPSEDRGEDVSGEEGGPRLALDCTYPFLCLSFAFYFVYIFWHGGISIMTGQAGPGFGEKLYSQAPLLRGRCHGPPGRM